MITSAFVERLFSAASIERWNDHPRPDAFTELGKQAHKMMIAWLIAMSEEEDGTNADWDALIECDLFEFLHRVVVTDIRPPVFHQLMRNKDDKRKLNKWVERQLHNEIEPIPGGFADRFREYFDDEDSHPLERKILRAAHYLATQWEFGFIQTWSGDMYGIDKTRSEIHSQVWEQSDLSMVQRILEAPRAREGAFVSLVGQLTFQKRWAQTPRIPATSVLGHLFFVAAMSWFTSLEIGACQRRRRNNFLGGLFHDIPEVLTRDIISPVKKSVEGLSELVSNYEHEAMRDRILKLISEKCGRDLCYYTQDEFKSKTRIGDDVKIHEGDPPDDDALDPIDGKLIEVCDKFAAYIECVSSIRNGVAPKALSEGKASMYDRYHEVNICGYPIGALFDMFK